MDLTLCEKCGKKIEYLSSLSHMTIEARETDKHEPGKIRYTYACSCGNKVKRFLIYKEK